MTSLKKISAFAISTILFNACNDHKTGPSQQAIDQLQLKRGEIVLCGPPEKEFGTVSFPIDGSPQTKADFNTAVELLHSFEYDEAEKQFAKIIDEAPATPMAYWGVAMCNYHPLWEPPSEADCKKGENAIAIARSIKGQSPKESAWIDAIAAYFKDWKTTDPHSRSIHFESAMQQLHQKDTADPEAAIFYALSLTASADPTDKTYNHQKKAGALLDSLYKTTPNHPGIIHYIIHTYDYPGIAGMGLRAALKYAEVAPSSAHALHMPSHIFTRLGMWDESIRLNTRSVQAAQCYAQSTGIRGHWDEELHGLDYLVYAYLQKGDNDSAKQQLKYLSTIREVHPINFKEAYTFAAAPTRMALENKDWTAAAQLTIQPDSFPWIRFPWQAAIVHFGKLLGYTHTGNPAAAKKELDKLDSLHEVLLSQKDTYKARQVEIQMIAGQAWIAHAKSDQTQAEQLMLKAANLEDSTTKHPVTPGEVLPARELYADLLLDLHQYKAAFTEYQAVLQRSPNRFNSIYGAAHTAELQGDLINTGMYYQQLLGMAAPNTTRPELKSAKAYMKIKNS